MKIYSLQADQHFLRPMPAVFLFFADARNLELITPPWLRFRILSPGKIEMQAGCRIDYGLRLHGIPIRWQSEITVWEPPHRFVDEQRKGPYRLWIHEHTFEEADGGTWVRDRVRYAVPGGILIQRFVVEPDLAKIFEYRRRELSRILA